MQIPFVIYIEFQSNLKKVRQPDRDNLMHPIPMIIKSILLVVMVCKVVRIDERISKPIQMYQCENPSLQVYWKNAGRNWVF